MKNVVEFPDTSAIKEESARWLIRLDGDDPLSAQEEEELRAWLNRSDAHREQLHKLAGLWGKMNVLTELAVPLGSVSRRSPVWQIRPAGPRGQIPPETGRRGSSVWDDVVRAGWRASP